MSGDLNMADHNIGDVNALGVNVIYDPEDSRVDVSDNLGVNGIVYAKGFQQVSDRQLKENITNITAALEKISKLRGVTFKWKETGKKDIGLIAQEVEEVIPEAVVEKDGLKYINYDTLIPLLIEAIKEQQKEIDELKQQIRYMNSTCRYK
jgi:polyhydroxyalkanoate synthesis regulator protein